MSKTKEFNHEEIYKGLSEAEQELNKTVKITGKCETAKRLAKERKDDVNKK